MNRMMMFALLAGACGREQHIATDAAPPDVSTDTLAPSTGDVPADAVSIRVTRNGAPVAGVAALFQSSTSELIESELTNQDGVAWARMVEGGFVTTIDNSSGTEELTTFASVTLGDQLHLDLSPIGSRELRPIKLEFSPDLSGATGYTVYTSCSEPYGFTVGAPQSPAPPNEMLLSGCTDGTADIVIVSLQDGEPTGRVLYAPSVTLPAAVPPQHFDADPLPPAPLLQLTGSYVSLEQHIIQITNVPATVASVGVHQAISALHRVYGQSGSDAPNTGGGVRIELMMPPASTSMLTATSTYPVGGEHGQQVILDWATPTITYALDLGGALLPGYTARPTFDAATRQLTWTERASATQPDAVRATIGIYRDDIPTGRAWRWRIAAARSGTTVTFPQLPVLGFDFNPSATDAISVSELTTVKLPGGYATVRENAFGDINDAVFGAAGRIVVQTLHSDAEPL